MGTVRSITDSVSSALGTDGGGGGLLGAVSDVGQAVSDNVSHWGQVVSTSPIGRAVITGAGAYFGVPPSVTAGLLAANSVGQGQSIGEAAGQGLTSYAMGTAVNGMMNPATTGAGGAVSTAAPDAVFTGAGADGIMTNAEAMSYGLTGGGVTGGAGAATSGGFMNQLLGQATKGVGGYLQQQTNQNAAQNQANMLNQSAASAAAAGKFRPVGVTSRFGSSNFQLDSNGNLVNAAYNLAPDVQAQQDALMGMGSNYLTQAAGAKDATAGMGQAAGRMMGLGNQYLATDPQAQAAKYLADQQGLLAPGRADSMARLQAQMQAQGRGGIATGGGVNGQLAANPQMQAYLNAQMQQDAQLAANATQGGMDYAKFGGGLVGSGGTMLQDMYKTQGAAFSPYTTAMGGAQNLETLGQGAMKMGADFGTSVMNGSQWGANLMNNATIGGAGELLKANQQDPWATMLMNAGNSPQGQQAIGGMLSGAGSAIGNGLSSAVGDFMDWVNPGWAGI